jgi:hypothetical protein
MGNKGRADASFEVDDAQRSSLSMIGANFRVAAGCISDGFMPNTLVRGIGSLEIVDVMSTLHDTPNGP